MITNIRITNSSGILEEVNFDLKKGKYDYRNNFIYKDTVVNPAVLYGRNGSGKTSILKTINNIIQIFSGDLTDGLYYAMPHMFTDNKITIIVLEFILDKQNYEYEVHIEDKDTIVYECVKAAGEIIVLRAPKKCRISNVVKEIDDEELINNLSSNLSIVRYVGMNAINEEVSKIYSYFKSFTFVGTNKTIATIGSNESAADRLVKYNDKYAEILSDFQHIMPLTFRIEKEPDRKRIIALYDVGNKTYELDFETQVSSGTRDLYKMIAMLLSQKAGSLIVIDELEKTFHPELLDSLVTKVISKLDVQIICSTHNTHLLTMLRPDQVYFTNKKNNMTLLSRLSKEHSGIREIHNIEKLYFGGRIG